jgi:hypothetical protein
VGSERARRCSAEREQRGCERAARRASCKSRSVGPAALQPPMATPPDSPVDDGAFELEPSRAAIKHRPVALEDLCRQTKFSRHEIRVMYRGFKQASFQPLKPKTTPSTSHVGSGAEKTTLFKVHLRSAASFIVQSNYPKQPLSKSKRLELMPTLILCNPLLQPTLITRTTCPTAKNPKSYKFFIPSRMQLIAGIPTPIMETALHSTILIF